MTDELLVVGRITKPHGLDGEVIVDLVTDRTERLDAGSRLHSDRGELVVVSATPHQKRWRVRFEGVRYRDQAEDLRGVELRAEPIEDEGVLFVHELVGRPVLLADGTTVGTCVAVVDNPAHDLLELVDGSLVPTPFVVDVDDDGIHIDPPDGLFDAQG